MTTGQRVAFQPAGSNCADWGTLGTVITCPAVDPDGTARPDMVEVRWDDDETEILTVDEVYPA